MTAPTEKLLAAIAPLRQTGKPLRIAIDGRCTAGKTTLAEALHVQTGCAVFHMDDFFLRPEQRTPERLAEPGGNVDRERFLEEVMQPLTRGEPVSFRRFDCHTMALRPAQTVAPAELTVVEGTYACHPALWDFYDLHVFLTVSPETQLRRLEKRPGADVDMFRTRWIVLEERYFSAFDLARRCEVCICTE